MKVLIIGGGGREHTLVWKIKKSRWVKKVYCAPGNAGISRIAQCVPIGDNRIDELLQFAIDEGIDLTVVGPEAPLATGIVDRFEEKGLKIFGPSGRAARIESSKIFAKNLMNRYQVPTAKAVEFDDPETARRYIRKNGAPLVVKVDGLAAGKGAFPCEDEMEALSAVDMIASGSFGESGNRILIEEYLRGEEASILAFCDGKHVLPLASSQDHKRAYDNDTGPNTGGMGAYSPAPVINEDMASRIYDEILVPTVKGLSKEGCPYKGILYAGLIITQEGPKVIEFNCRFGDPETQVVLPRMATDIIRPILACCDGTLDKVKLRWSHNKAVCVVMASGGYPGKYEKGYRIKGIDEVEREENVIVFHAGTRLDESGNVVTSGGRVLGVTALDSTIRDSIMKSYDAVNRISFKKAQFRGDIGMKALHHMEEL